jgi:ATP synthase protein I
MADDRFDERIRALEERIRRAESGRAGPPPRRTGYEHSSLAYRMVTELVVGMGLGVAIGYGLDSLLNTWPLFLVIFSLLGCAAGVKTMLRSAEEVNKGQPVDAPPGASADGGKDRNGPTE